MRKFRRNRAPVSVLVACLALACHPASFFGGGMRNHPAALVGQWVDSAKASPTDTSLWILDASGNDESQHVRLDSNADHTTPAAFVTTRATHYGYWFFQGTLQDSTDRAICFTNRPGRSAPTCRPFDLDSVSTARGMRRRLVVRGYQGEHETSNRILLERLP